MAKILIAEDDQFLSKMYKVSLEEAGYDLDFVSNGEDALVEIEKENPDLLILDLLMPKVDGFAVLEHINAKGYSFPIMVLTNLSKDVDQEKCKGLGVTDFFPKSEIDLDRLLELINLRLQA